MSSSPALVAWQQKYATDITQGASDAKMARRKLDAAVVHVGRAKDLLARREYDLALNSAETALVVSCDAVLSKHGYTVRSHVARFAYPLLPSVLTQNATLMNRIRTARRLLKRIRPFIDEQQGAVAREDLLVRMAGAKPTPTNPVDAPPVITHDSAGSPPVISAETPPSQTA